MTDINIIILSEVDHNIRLADSAPIPEPVVIDSAVSDAITLSDLSYIVREEWPIDEDGHLAPTPEAMDESQPETTQRPAGAADNPLSHIEMGDGSILQLSSSWRDDGTGNLVRVD